MYLPLDGTLKHQAWAGLEWIWTPGDLAPWPPEGTGSRFFRRTLVLETQPIRAWIQVWSNIGYELWVNGLSAYRSPRGIGWSHQDEIEHLLRPGENTIAVEFYGGSWRYWASGLLLAGEIESADGRVLPVRSDTSWRCRPDPVAAWYHPDAAPDGWGPAVRTVEGWQAAGAPCDRFGKAPVEYASFDPAVFRRQLADFYDTDEPERLHIPGERYVAFQGGGYWAPLEKLPDGSIAAVVRAGGCHSGRDGRLLFIRSRDGGKGWSSPIIVADSAWNDYGCALGALADGTLLVGYRKYRNYDGAGNFIDRGDSSYPTYGETLVIRSEDGGETWEPPRPTSERGEPPNLPYGKMIEFPDSTVWLAEYLGVPYFRASHDRGRTWGPLRTITSEDCNETALCRLREGRVVAAIRGGAAVGGACWVTTTDDEGANWSAPVRITEPWEMPPDLIQLQSGRLLLTFGRRTFPHGVQVMFSDDLGQTWYRPERHILTADAFHDHGYPSSVQLADGTIVTIYYATGNRVHPEIGVHTGVVRWRDEG